MTSLQVLSDAAHAAFLEAMAEGAFQRAERLHRIANAIERELGGNAHHPNCECSRCFSNMGDDA